MEKGEWHPGSLLAVSGAYWQSCVLHAAIKLELFASIGRDRLTAKQVVQRLEADTRGTEMLLNALAAMNLLEKTGDNYANTEAGLAYLIRESPYYVGHSILLFHHMMSSWLELERAVLSGEPIRVRPSSTDPVYRDSFQRSMHTMAMHLAPQVAKAIDLSTRHHLLDLGGGPGTYSVHFCRHYPHLKATVYDLSTTKPYAESSIQQFGLTDRIQFKEVNYLEEELEGRYDVAWLSQVLHSESPEDCRMIIQKAASALVPGGMIIIHDLIMNNEMDGPLFSALFSLNMLVLTPQGRAYSEEQIMAMLAEAGAEKIRRIPFQGPHESGIITGVIP